MEVDLWLPGMTHRGQKFKCKPIEQSLGKNTQRIFALKDINQHLKINWSRKCRSSSNNNSSNHLEAM